MNAKLFFITLLTCLFSCSSDDIEVIDPEDPQSSLYFPPINGNQWETLSPSELGWDTDLLADLFDFHEENGSRAFIVLKEGKIVVEEYWNNNILDTEPFTQNSIWYWASAGKSLSALLVGLAQEKGHLSITEPSSSYLGQGWTSMPIDKENEITIEHHLTMTTGLDFNVPDLNCIDPSCLTYRKDAGTQWYYHNAPYSLLKNIVEEATGQTYNQFTQEHVSSKIGLSGNWVQANGLNLYWSTPRDMARYGLLVLNEGIWDSEPVLHDGVYFEQMINTSQSINRSYGYLWWLNGKNSIVYPGYETPFPSDALPNAPDDLVAALGKNGQVIFVIPSTNMVVVRIGTAPDNSAVPLFFMDEMWEKLNQIIR